MSLELSPLVSSARWSVVFLVLGNLLGAFYLTAATNFYCIPVFCPNWGYI